MNRARAGSTAELVVLSGTSHAALAEAIAGRLGVALAARALERFPDGEHSVALKSDVRGADVFIIQSLRAPVGDHLLELLLLADACRRSGAARVTAVIPYLAYARQDRRDLEGVPLGAKVVADVLGTVLDRAVLVDLHSPPVEAAFAIPVEHVSCLSLLAEHARANTESAVVVSPDLGAAKRAERFARPLGLDVAIVHKSRLSGSKVEARAVVGDVRGLRPLIIDDIISTAGTIEAAVRSLREAGASDDISVFATHGLFVPPASERLRPLGLQRVVVTDTVPPPADLPFPLERVSCAPVLADAIRRLHG